MAWPKGKPFTKEMKENMRKAQLGRKHPEEVKRKIGMAHKGIPKSEKHRKKLSEALVGHISWNLGVPCSAETKEKIRLGNLGKTISEETRRKTSLAGKGRIPWNLGKTLTEEHKRKVSEAVRGEKNGFYGKAHSIKTRKRLSESHKGIFDGEKNPFYGKTHTDEVKELIGNLHRGEKNHWWNGGSSFEPYSSEFNRVLKAEIKNRDDNVCQFCGVSSCDKGLDVHHIDGDKKNNEKANLVSLCVPCHLKTRKDRPKWTFMFTSLNEIRSTQWQR